MCGYLVGRRRHAYERSRETIERFYLRNLPSSTVGRRDFESTYLMIIHPVLVHLALYVGKGKTSKLNGAMSVLRSFKGVTTVTVDHELTITSGYKHA